MSSRKLEASLSCLLSNIRSVIKNAEPLIFRIRYSCLDLIALTETWLSTSLDNATILGRLCAEYSVVRCDRAKRKGGGVALLIRKIFSHNIILAESVDGGYDILCCDLATRDRLFRFCLVYMAPDCTAGSTDQLLKAITDLSTTEYPFIVLGDLNMPDIKWAGVSITSRCSLSREFIRMCENLGLTQLVRTQLVKNIFWT